MASRSSLVMLSARARVGREIQDGSRIIAKLRGLTKQGTQETEFVFALNREASVTVIAIPLALRRASACAVKPADGLTPFGWRSASLLRTFRLGMASGTR